MSMFEKTPADQLKPGQWAILRGWLSRVATVAPHGDGGATVTTDRGWVGEVQISDRLEVSRLREGADLEEAAALARRNAQPRRRHVGAAQVAEQLGITRSTVTKSLRRHGPTSATPFPEPAVYVGDIPGWAPQQVEDIRAWFDRPAQGRRRTAAEGARDQVRTGADAEAPPLLDAAWRTRIFETATTDPHWAAVSAMQAIAKAHGVEVDELSAAIPGHIQDLRDAADARDRFKIFTAAWAAQGAAEKRLGGRQAE